MFLFPPGLYFRPEAGAGITAVNMTVMRTEGESHQGHLAWPRKEQSSHQVCTVQRYCLESTLSLEQVCRKVEGNSWLLEGNFYLGFPSSLAYIQYRCCKYRDSFPG